MRFPVPSYAEYLVSNQLEHSQQHLEEFTQYANKLMNLETLYFSLIEKLGIQNA